MNDLQQLKQAKDRCIADISDALVNYSGRLNSIDERLMIYIEDALSNHASHSNLYEILGIRKVFRLMSSYELDGERVQRTLRAIEGVWENGRHQKAAIKREQCREPRFRALPSVSRLARQGKGGLKFDTTTNFASKREQCQMTEQREPKGCSHPLGRVATEFARKGKSHLSIAEREQSQDRDSGINYTN